MVAVVHFIILIGVRAQAPDLSQKALTAMGWKQADHFPREKMALMWVEKGLLAFASVAYQDDKVAPIVGFHRPEVVTPKDGPITVTLWTERPTGMRNEKPSYQRLTYRSSLTARLNRRRQRKG